MVLICKWRCYTTPSNWIQSCVISSFICLSVLGCTYTLFSIIDIGIIKCKAAEKYTDTINDYGLPISQRNWPQIIAFMWIQPYRLVHMHELHDESSEAEAD